MNNCHYPLIYHSPRIYKVHLQCPMPNAPFPIPHSPFPIPHFQFSILNSQFSILDIS
ncbi:MAG: hypothetical protein F6K31_26730 [Symploca sp. SIO2G7]|nr:hypothetical protein [Symploca sp. SIO2G7]